MLIPNDNLSLLWALIAYRFIFLSDVHRDGESVKGSHQLGSSIWRRWGTDAPGLLITRFFTQL